VKKFVSISICELPKEEKKNLENFRFDFNNMLWVYNNFRSTTTYNSLGHIYNHGAQKDGLMEKG
jgi:hypothetical protein